MCRCLDSRTDRPTVTNLHECISSPPPPPKHLLAHPPPCLSICSSPVPLLLRSRQPVCPVIWGLVLPRVTKISKIFSSKSVETISSRGHRGQSPGCLAGPAAELRVRMNTGEPNCGGVRHLWLALSRPPGDRARIPLPCLPLAPQWLNGRQVAGPLACLQGDTLPPSCCL